MKLIVLLLAVCSVVLSQSCNYDYNCGNIPYRYCAGGDDDCSRTLDGIAVEGGYIYYAQICRTLDFFTNITFKRIPVAGGVPDDITTRIQYPAPVNPQKILGAVGDYIFYDIVLRLPGRGLRSFNIPSTTEYEIVPISLFPQSYFEYDTATSNTYFCNYAISGGMNNYTIEKANGITTQGNLESSATLYITPMTQSCGPVRRYGANEIFFVTYSYDYSAPTTTIYSSIYRGSTTCVGCSLPSPFYSIADQITDMSISGEYLVYGTRSGLYRIRLDGSGLTMLSAMSVIGIEAVGSTIYFNNGYDILAVDINGAGSRQLNQLPTGQCVCRPVFTGERCQTCNGQVQWDSNSQPNCVPLTSAGNPATCVQDYQCNNPPYTICLGTCQCRGNFTGDRCDQCAYQVTWNEYGAPQCQ